MTALEATVEVVKAALLQSPGGASNSVSNAYFLSDEKYADKLANSIEVIYKKFKSLEGK